MLKIFFVGLWVSVATLVTATYVLLRMLGAGKLGELESSKIISERNSDLVRGELLVIPVISEGDVQAYFTVKLSFIVDKEKLKKVDYFLQDIANDYLHTLLIGSPIVTLSKFKNFDVKNFRETIKEGLNAKFGVDIVLDVLIDKIDYLSKNTICFNANNPARKKMKLLGSPRLEGTKESSLQE